MIGGLQGNPDVRPGVVSATATLGDSHSCAQTRR